MNNEIPNKIKSNNFDANCQSNSLSAHKENLQNTEQHENLLCSASNELEEKNEDMMNVSSSWFFELTQENELIKKRNDDLEREKSKQEKEASEMEAKLSEVIKQLENAKKTEVHQNGHRTPAFSRDEKNIALKKKLLQKTNIIERSQRILAACRFQLLRKNKVIMTLGAHIKEIWEVVAEFGSMLDNHELLEQHKKNSVLKKCEELLSLKMLPAESGSAIYDTIKSFSTISEAAISESLSVNAENQDVDSFALESSPSIFVSPEIETANPVNGLHSHQNVLENEDSDKNQVFETPLSQKEVLFPSIHMAFSIAPFIDINTHKTSNAEKYSPSKNIEVNLKASTDNDFLELKETENNDLSTPNSKNKHCIEISVQPAMPKIIENSVHSVSTTLMEDLYLSEESLDCLLPNCNSSYDVADQDNKNFENIDKSKNDSVLTELKESTLDSSVPSLKCEIGKSNSDECSNMNKKDLRQESSKESGSSLSCDLATYLFNENGLQESDGHITFEKECESDLCLNQNGDLSASTISEKEPIVKPFILNNESIENKFFISENAENGNRKSFLPSAFVVGEKQNKSSNSTEKNKSYHSFSDSSKESKQKQTFDDLLFELMKESGLEHNSTLPSLDSETENNTIKEEIPESAFFYSIPTCCSTITNSMPSIKVDTILNTKTTENNINTCKEINMQIIENSISFSEMSNENIDSIETVTNKVPTTLSKDCIVNSHSECPSKSTDHSASDENSSIEDLCNIDNEDIRTDTFEANHLLFNSSANNSSENSISCNECKAAENGNGAIVSKIVDKKASPVDKIPPSNESNIDSDPIPYLLGNVPNLSLSAISSDTDGSDNIEQESLNYVNKSKSKKPKQKVKQKIKKSKIMKNKKNSQSKKKKKCLNQIMNTDDGNVTDTSGNSLRIASECHLKILSETINLNKNSVFTKTDVKNRNNERKITSKKKITSNVSKNNTNIIASTDEPSEIMLSFEDIDLNSDKRRFEDPTVVDDPYALFGMPLSDKNILNGFENVEIGFSNTNDFKCSSMFIPHESGEETDICERNSASDDDVSMSEYFLTDLPKRSVDHVSPTLQCSDNFKLKLFSESIENDLGKKDVATDQIERKCVYFDDASLDSECLSLSNHAESIDKEKDLVSPSDCFKESGLSVMSNEIPGTFEDILLKHMEEQKIGDKDPAPTNFINLIRKNSAVSFEDILNAHMKDVRLLETNKNASKVREQGKSNVAVTAKTTSLNFNDSDFVYDVNLQLDLITHKFKYNPGDSEDTSKNGTRIKSHTPSNHKRAKQIQIGILPSDNILSQFSSQGTDITKDNNTPSDCGVVTLDLNSQESDQLNSSQLDCKFYTSSDFEIAEAVPEKLDSIASDVETTRNEIFPSLKQCCVLLKKIDFDSQDCISINNKDTIEENKTYTENSNKVQGTGIIQGSDITKEDNIPSDCGVETLDLYSQESVQLNSSQLDCKFYSSSDFEIAEAVPEKLDSIAADVETTRKEIFPSLKQCCVLLKKIDCDSQDCVSINNQDTIDKNKTYTENRNKEKVIVDKRSNSETSKCSNLNKTVEDYINKENNGVDFTQSCFVLLERVKVPTLNFNAGVNEYQTHEQKSVTTPLKSVCETENCPEIISKNKKSALKSKSKQSSTKKRSPPKRFKFSVHNSDITQTSPNIFNYMQKKKCSKKKMESIKNIDLDATNNHKMKECSIVLNPIDLSQWKHSSQTNSYVIETKLSTKINDIDANRDAELNNYASFIKTRGKYNDTNNQLPISAPKAITKQKENKDGTNQIPINKDNPMKRENVFFLNKTSNYNTFHSSIISSSQDKTTSTPTTSQKSKKMFPLKDLENKNSNEFSTCDASTTQVSIPLRRSKRNNPEKLESCKTKQVCSELKINTIEGFFENLKHLDVNFKTSILLLKEILTNTENYPDISSLLFAVIKYLSLSENNPLLMFLECENKSVLLPQDEECIITAFFEIELEEISHLKGLLNVVVNLIQNLLISNKTIAIYGVAALCRFVTEISKRKEDKQTPLNLCSNLLKTKHQFSPFLIATIVSTWMELFKETSNLQDEETIFRSSIFYGATKRMDLTDSDWNASTKILNNYFFSRPVVDVQKSIRFLMNTIQVSCCDESWIHCHWLVSAVVHFSIHEDWKWIEKNILNQYVVPLLRELGSEGINCKAFDLLCNLYVDLIYLNPSTFPREEVLIKFFKKENMLRGCTFVQESSALALMKLILLKNIPLPKLLTRWFEKNSSNPKVIAIKTLFTGRKSKNCDGTQLLKEDFDINNT